MPMQTVVTTATPCGMPALTIQPLHTAIRMTTPPPREVDIIPDPRPMKRSASAPKLSESKSLQNETKDLLGRAGVVGVARRCAHYKPSLKELSSTSFSDYIRGEVLGVPLPGYEFLYVYQDPKESKREQQVPRPVCSTPPLCQELPPLVVPRSKQISSIPVPVLPKKADRTMRTRSQSQAIASTKKAPTNLLMPKHSSVPEPKKYKMCWYKLRDGIAKVSLPAGFGAKVDATARGRLWAKGTKLGDTVIPAPIKQCLSGIGGVYQYTLIEQPPTTVAEFRTQADEYRKRQLGKEVDDEDSEEFFDELARKFWRRLGPTMEPAVYGADMDGSLFNDAHASGWNVDRLESCLCLLRADAKGGDRDDEVFHLPGVTSAYLYFGMWASAFAAHTEDMNLLSINYLHAGSPKYWYAVNPEDSKRFENLARSHFPGQASECQEFLRHKRCLLSPAILKKAGIRFTTCVQRPGDAIITFPGSYHFGFNTGFNVAESTNFAVPEWIPIGEAANCCMCVPYSVRIQMKRLKALLDDYERDMCFREATGMPKLTYSSWAKHEAKRLKKECTKRGADKEHIFSLDLPTTYNKSIAVEVTRESIIPKKSGRKLKREEFNEWRLAKKVRPGAFVLNADVICLISCFDSDGRKGSNDDQDYEFFFGTIVKVFDGYVKVHFAGLNRQDDQWFEQDSDYLFLDGGLTDPPTSDDENDTLNECKAKSKSQNLKKRCR